MTWKRTIALAAAWIVLFGFVVAVLLPRAVRAARDSEIGVWAREHCGIQPVWVEAPQNRMKAIPVVWCRFKLGGNPFIRRRGGSKSAQEPARPGQDPHTDPSFRRSGAGLGAGARALDLVQTVADRIRGHVLGHKKPGRIAEVGPGRKCDDSKGRRLDARVQIPPCPRIGSVTHSGWNRAGRLGRYIRRNACLGECPLAEPNSERGPVKSGAITATVQRKGLWTLANLKLTRQDAGGDTAPSHNGGASDLRRGMVETYDAGENQESDVRACSANPDWTRRFNSGPRLPNFVGQVGRRRCDGVTLHALAGNRGTHPGSRRERVPGRGNRGMAGAGTPARTNAIGESRQGTASKLGSVPPGQTREGPCGAAAGDGPKHLGCRRAKNRASHGLPIVTPDASGDVLILTGQGPEPSGPDARGWPSGAAA